MSNNPLPFRSNEQQLAMKEIPALAWEIMAASEPHSIAFRNAERIWMLTAPPEIRGDRPIKIVITYV